MVKRLFNRVYRWPPSAKAAVTAVFAIVAFGIGAILQNGVTRITGPQPGDRPWGLFWLLVTLVVAGVWGAFQYVYRRIIESVARDVQTRERAIADARERITKLTVQQLAQCDSMMEHERVSIDELRTVLICEVGRVNSLITAAWEVVNSHHNVSVAATERINFEMTLITPSLRDGELTIASWCNRENHRPKSLLLRSQGETEIYRQTEAFKMMSTSLTETRVIQDTSDPTENYEPLYEGQKMRIRSSVLHPILSPKSEHLGVLVLHCERAGFFRSVDSRYWHELFSVFAPSIALELERIKAFNKAVLAWPAPPSEPYKPY